MPAPRAFRSAALTLALAGPLLASAQTAEPWSLVPTTARQSVGFNVQKAAVALGCGSSILPCADERAALAAREPSSFRWALELGPMSPAASNRLALSNARQGLNLSLVGRKPLFGSSFSVYGKLGAGVATPDASTALAATPGTEGYGLSFGGGVSWDFSPKLSATFGWESQELRFGAGTRDAVRSTTMGLQYRY